MRSPADYCAEMKAVRAIACKLHLTLDVAAEYCVARDP